MYAYMCLYVVGQGKCPWQGIRGTLLLPVYCWVLVDCAPPGFDGNTEAADQGHIILILLSLGVWLTTTLTILLSAGCTTED